MTNPVEFLSGNVPGGIFLYGFVVLVTFIVLYFMYRVNELFTRRHLVRWTIITILLYSILYVAIWLKRPPRFLYKKYTVDLVETPTGSNWFGKYLTERIANYVKPFESDKNYFFPARWLFRMSPVDSIEKAGFRERIYRRLPVEKVLKMKVEGSYRTFTVDAEMVIYPSGEVLKSAKNSFRVTALNEFDQWVLSQFTQTIPFKKPENLNSPEPPDSILSIAKYEFFAKEYQNCLKILEGGPGKKSPAPEHDIWIQYAKIKMAGRERQKNPPSNPYSSKIPSWKKELESARNKIVEYLRLGFEEPLANLMVAESYIWEEQFSTAEIFLEKAFVDNPMDIDVLLDLSFFHPSRYRELGFERVRDIYQKILLLCPVDEEVLIKYSQFLLENHPAYTPDPAIAKKYLRRYLAMNPYSERIWMMLGEIQSKQSLREEALHSFMKADSLNPGDGLINYNIGVLYYEWERTDQAKIFFERSIQFDNYLNSYLYLGAIQKEQGDCERALKNFRYRVEHKTGENDRYAAEAMKGIRECLQMMGKPAGGELQ